MARKAPKGDQPRSVTEDAVTVYTYPARRKNNPPAGIEAHGSFQEAQRIRHEYNPHLAPVLRSSPETATTDGLPNRLRKALHGTLSKDEVKLPANLLDIPGEATDDKN